MSLLTLKQRVCRKTGLLVGSDDAYVEELINEAAREVWETHDLPNCLVEASVGVQSGGRVALPHFMGEIRGIRESDTMYRTVLTDMRPKYSYEPEAYDADVWRLIGKRPIAITPQSMGRIKFVQAELNSDVSITIEGSTATAQSVIETLDLDALEVITTNLWLDLRSIKKDALTTCNIEIYSEGDELLGIFPNNRYVCEYTIVDVSTYPGRSLTDNCAVEVLYKPPYYPMSGDASEFQLDGYDDVIYYRTVALWYLAQKDGGQLAEVYAGRAESRIKSIVQNQSGHVEKFMNFAPNRMNYSWGRKIYPSIYPR